mmetsp:Transcript_19515/g.65527  ORF Transcript_19515/g.65527 Transcript_19515/m.65527 type:complete len:307 (-) Transcript_19515:846-1766(-)
MIARLYAFFTSEGWRRFASDTGSQPRPGGSTSCRVDRMARMFCLDPRHASTRCLTVRSRLSLVSRRSASSASRFTKAARLASTSWAMRAWRSRICSCTVRESWGSCPKEAKGSAPSAKLGCGVTGGAPPKPRKSSPPCAGGADAACAAFGGAESKARKSSIESEAAPPPCAAPLVGPMPPMRSPPPAAWGCGALSKPPRRSISPPPPTPPPGAGPPPMPPKRSTSPPGPELDGAVGPADPGSRRLWEGGGCGWAGPGAGLARGWGGVPWGELRSGGDGPRACGALGPPCPAACRATSCSRTARQSA